MDILDFLCTEFDILDYGHFFLFSYEFLSIDHSKVSLLARCADSNVVSTIILSRLPTQPPPIYMV